MITKAEDLTSKSADGKGPDGKGYNECPANLRLIDQHEFARKLGGPYSPSEIEYRQIQGDEIPKDIQDAIGGKWLSLHIFWYYDKTGVAVISKWNGTRHGSKPEWEGFFFAVGCQHDYRELSYQTCKEQGITHMGNCYHVYKCQKCGFVDAHDSSD